VHIDGSGYRGYVGAAVVTLVGYFKHNYMGADTQFMVYVAKL
jgi:hypothetical protein